MTRHPNGAVTLTADEFAACAAFLEMRPCDFADLLEAKEDDGLSPSDILQRVLQTLELIHLPDSNPH